MAAKKVQSTGNDELSEAIHAGLNKDGFETFFLGSDATSTDLKDFISTGSSRLDLAVSNRPYGGIACGRITELTGLEGSGKSLIAAHLMANVQKEGGVACLLDTETAVNEEFFRAIGLQMGPGKMIYRQPGCVEEIFETIEKVIEIVKKTDPKQQKKVIIVVDSVAASPTRKELAGDYDKDGYATDKAIIISKAMRKITDMIGKNKIALVFTNQLRQKMNAPAFSDPWTTSGGKAIAFHASTRLRISQVGKIANKDKEVIGVKVKVVVVKNRLGPPLRTAEFEVYFDRGIDDVGSWLDFLKDKGLIQGASGRYTYVDTNGEEHKFQKSTWREFSATNQLIVDELYNKMCAAVIMSYASDGVSLDDGTAEVQDGEE